MEKVFLIAGKEYPSCEDFAHFLEKMGGKVMVAGSEFSGQVPFTHSVWNRNSAISARSLVLETETILGQTDIAFVIFDTEQYLDKFSKLTMDEISKGIDFFIAGYIQLTMELVNRFIKMGKGNICFLVKKHPSLAEMHRNPKKADVIPANPLLSAAENSFLAFAENMAVKYAQTKLGIQLVDYSNTDNEKENLYPWLIEYLESAFIKPEVSAKSAAKWITPGTKYSAGWPFFKK